MEDADGDTALSAILSLASQEDLPEEEPRTEARSEPNGCGSKSNRRVAKGLVHVPTYQGSIWYRNEKHYEDCVLSGLSSSSSPRKLQMWKVGTIWATVTICCSGIDHDGGTRWLTANVMTVFDTRGAAKILFGSMGKPHPHSVSQTGDLIWDEGNQGQPKASTRPAPDQPQYGKSTCSPMKLPY